jgi:hypothetical protein
MVVLSFCYDSIQRGLVVLSALPAGVYSAGRKVPIRLPLARVKQRFTPPDSLWRRSRQVIALSG